MTRYPRFVYDIEDYRKQICVSLPQPGHGLYYTRYFYDVDEWEDVKREVLKDIAWVDEMIRREGRA